MGAEGEAFAKQFKAKAEKATALPRSCAASPTPSSRKTGTVFTGMPPMSAEEMVRRALLDHIDEHFGSIRTTIGG